MNDMTSNEAVLMKWRKTLEYYNVKKKMKALRASIEAQLHKNSETLKSIT